MQALKRYKVITSTRNSRKTLMKMYFASNHEIMTREDKEEVYFLYNLLEDLE
jgi:hypothetical protein